MEISRILKGVELCSTFKDGDVQAVSCDSRTCTRGSLFVAVRGADTDGHSYIGKAIEMGASHIVCEEIPQQVKDADAEFILVKESRKAVAQIASNFYGNPSEKLRVVAVTGTNGKTSIATLLYNLFTKLGYCCGLLSTIANYVGNRRYETLNTTPGPMELNRLLAQMADQGCEFCFMEASSHAIDQQRTEGIKFEGAIFTNLTHDHLDYHKTFANYLACKKRLFDTLPKDAFALTNIDDRNGEIMVQNTKAQIHTYSCRNWADFRVKILEKTIEGMLLNINGKEVWCRFIGVHNAANLTAVYGAAILLGAKEEETITAMSSLTSVAGRLEYFKGEDDI
ncbi:MAG: UDP-N-acetylmuramoyl-L-alanyl-D-glutamate--2,6-diaminopimelate ligase, partial [Bacteroidales bacterium]|nr:UDP-N-acetylmuramoyl-L-alanyl-D-glutamate--2,6-diaminopimelate ligase [Bacteroidales bacterium]